MLSAQMEAAANGRLGPPSNGAHGSRDSDSLSHGSDGEGYNHHRHSNGLESRREMQQPSAALVLAKVVVDDCFLT